MKIFLAGNWVDKPKKMEVRNPFDNSVIDTVPKADASDLEKALAFAERGGPISAGICQINLERDHIRLAFIHGAFLPDPKSLLQGDRQYKRYVKITSFDQAPWDDLQDLITASAHFDPRANAPRSIA